MTARSARIGIPLFDGADLLDVTAPMEVLELLLPKPEIVLPSADGGSVTLAPKLTVRATHSFASCPEVDVLMVPGGPGLDARLKDRDLLEFLRRRADEARWVTAVCAGSLLLAAAGLLDGHEATTHWASLPLLELFPEVTVVGKERGYPRYVRDGNRLTTGGVTSALDMSVFLAAELGGEQQAKNAELFLEYAPEPPFGVGNPNLADATTRARTGERLEPLIRRREEVIREILRA